MSHSFSYPRNSENCEPKDLPIPQEKPMLKIYTHAAHTIIIFFIIFITIPHLGQDFIPLSTMPKYTTKSACPPKAPSPTNVNSFPVNGWMMTTRPASSIVPGCIGKILSYEDYYFKSKCVLCTRAFLVAAISTTVDDGDFPPESTKLNDEMGHNCKMTKEQYRAFCRLVLGLDDDTWANYCSEGALHNMILQDLDVDAMMYYYNTD
jgi:hypothetical protein